MSEDRRDIYVGLMSGTSLDGISAAVVRFGGDDVMTHDVLGFSVRPYTVAQRDRLRAAMQGTTPEEYCRLNADLGGWLADAAIAVLAESGVARAEVRAVASHGQTMWHVPGHSTWQMGETAVIAERTGLDVVGDFRVRDVAAGGHGAPLVPMADALLYTHAREWRLLQNVGGMANVTVVPPGGALESVRAFDTGPGVAILDTLIQKSYADRAYDDGGAIAALGKVHDDVVTALLRDPYFVQEPPKSTGREYFGAEYVTRFLDRMGAASSEDLVATATAVTAVSIADAYARFIPEPVTEVLVSGGGARNETLMRMLQDAIDATARATPLRVRSFGDCFYDGEAKEAVAFALLGYLHVQRRPGNVTGATGARGPRVLGKWTPA